MVAARVRALALGGPRGTSTLRASRGSHVPQPRDDPRRRGAGGPPCDAPLTGSTCHRGPHGPGDYRASPTGLSRRRDRRPPAAGLLGAGSGRRVRRPALDRGPRPRRRAARGVDRGRRPVALRRRRLGAGQVRGGDHLLRGPAVLPPPRGGPAGPRPRGGAQPAPRARGERGQHAHHAGRAPLAPGPAAHARREGDRGHARAAAHAVALEAAGARPLRRLRPLRGQHGGPRRGGLALLRPRRPAALVGGDGDARGAAERPRPRAPRPQPRPAPGEAQPPPRGPAGPGRDRRDDGGARPA